MNPNGYCLLDCGFLAHRMRFMNGQRVSPFSVVHELLSYALDFMQIMRQSPVFCLDSRHSWRRKAFPEYKRHRHDDSSPEELAALREMQAQLNSCRGLLKGLGFRNVILQNGFESDDIIAQACLQYSCPFSVVSSDHDLYQVLRRGVGIYSPKRGYIGKAYTASSLFEEYGLKPSQWPEFKALAGCPSDNVPHAGRDWGGAIDCKIGEKTALAILHGELKPNVRKYLESPAGRARLERNRALVKLPMSRTRPLDLRDDCLDGDALRGAFREWGLSDFAEDRWDEWEEFLELISPESMHSGFAAAQ